MLASTKVILQVLSELPDHLRGDENEWQWGTRFYRLNGDAAEESRNGRWIGMPPADVPKLLADIALNIDLGGDPFYNHEFDKNWEALKKHADTRLGDWDTASRLGQIRFDFQEDKLRLFRWNETEPIAFLQANVWTDVSGKILTADEEMKLSKLERQKFRERTDVSLQTLAFPVFSAGMVGSGLEREDEAAQSLP